MNVFNRYAAFYDLLNQDKDYDAEAEYVDGLIKAYSSDPRSILEMGCGTGVHAVLMAQKGYSVYGVDVSKEMLQYADQRRAELEETLAENLIFSQGDICNLDVKHCFDVVISLFHVASYQTSNEHLMAMFSTAARHLKDNGLFVFDFWYGPAVLTDPPFEKIKHFENDKLKIMRATEPVMNPDKNIVDVNFQFSVLDKETGDIDEFKETHTMRYLFIPEIEMMLKNSGFEILDQQAWMGEQPLGLDTWNGVCVARQKGFSQ